MFAVPLRQIDVSPGGRIALQDISWSDFEQILVELGDRRSCRLAYSQGTLEIVAPLPAHEIAKVMLGDMVKILLEELDLDGESFGSTTFKHPELKFGIEPDDSFYIKNYQQMIGKQRIDLSIDPPPDLAIEVDLTSKTQLDAYLALGVPELWRYDEDALEINLLVKDRYQHSISSAIFPNLPLTVMLPHCLIQSRSIGRSKALKAFRRLVRDRQV
jgi:Uma2 family endonuclease